MKMGHFQDFEVHSTSRAKPVPWVAHTGELVTSYWWVNIHTLWYAVYVSYMFGILKITLYN